MKIFDWFKPENKKNVVLPSGQEGPIRGMDLIYAFTTEDEPKVKDFPKDKYRVYWETFVDAIPGGYGAVVKFYSFEKGFLAEHRLSDKTVPKLKEAVNKLIRSTMEGNKV